MDSKNAYYIYKNRNYSDYFINVIIISFFFQYKTKFLWKQITTRKYISEEQLVLLLQKLLKISLYIAMWIYCIECYIEREI